MTLKKPQIAAFGIKRRALALRPISQRNGALAPGTLFAGQSDPFNAFIDPDNELKKPKHKSLESVTIGVELFRLLR